MANVFKGKVDIKNVRPNFKPVFVQYDHARLEIELLDNRRTYDLSTAKRVEFTHVRSDKLVITHPGEIVTDGDRKIIRYVYQGTEMDVIGLVDASFAVFDADDKKVSSHVFTVEIRKDLRDEQFNPAEPNFGLLQKLIDDVEDLKEHGGGGGSGQGPKGDPGYTPIKGVDYFDGRDGYTPIKGVDYFDGKDGKDGKDGRDGQDGYTPVKGVDYFDGKDGKDGIDGAPGRDGVDGEKGDPFTYADFTQSQLEALRGPQGEQGETGPPGSNANVTSATITSALGYTPARQTHTHSYNDLTDKPTIPTLNNTVTSTSTTEVATARAVKEAYDRANQAFTQASDGKNIITNAVTGKGGTVPGDPTFTQLASAITNLPTLKKSRSETFTSTKSLTVTNLGFVPSVIIIRSKMLNFDTFAVSTYITTEIDSGVTNIFNGYHVIANSFATAGVMSVNSNGFSIQFSNTENYQGMWVAFE